MGNNAGHLALYVGLAVGSPAIITPEKPCDFERDILERLREGRYNGRRHFLVIVAEGCGNTREIADRIRDEGGIETRVTTLGHIQRGGSPSAKDRTIASMMGHFAVEQLIAGKSGLVVCYRDSRLVTTEIGKALGMKKGLDEYMYRVATEFPSENENHPKILFRGDYKGRRFCYH